MCGLSVKLYCSRKLAYTVAGLSTYLSYCATDFNCNTDLVLLMKVYPTVAEHKVELKYVVVELNI